MGQFSLYQLLVPGFAAIMLAKAISRFCRGRQTLRELVVWIIVWTGLSAGALFPDFCMLWLSRLTGIKSGFNALIFFTLVVLIYTCLQLYIALEKQERRLTTLVRKIALQDVDDRGADPPA